MGRAVFISAADHHLAPVPTVYHRAQWGDSWTQNDSIRAVNVSRTTGRGLGEARLEYEYGLIQGPADLTPQTVAPLSIRNHWVKIEWSPTTGGGNYDFAVPNVGALPTSGIEDGQRALVEDENSVYVFNTGAWTDTGEGPTTGTETFYGICRDEIINELGSDGVPTGTQSLIVLSVEWLLTRKQAVESFVRIPPENYTSSVPTPGDLPGTANEGDRILVESTGTVWEYNTGAWGDTSDAPVHDRTIPAALPFNAAAGNPGSDIYRRANKQTGELAFADDLETAEEWNSRTILEYLLQRFPPTNSGAPSWEVQGSSAPLLEWEIPRDFRVHGQNMFDVINSLVDHRRGLMWWVETTEDADPMNERFSVVIESMLENDLTLPSGKTITKNANQYDVNINSEPGVGSLIRVVSTQRKFQSVVIEGRNLGAVASMEINVDAEELWTAADKTAYEVDETDPSDDDSTRRANNDRRRTADPDQRRVFTSFVATNWDLFYRGLDLTFPQLDWNGNEVMPLEQHETWGPAIRFLDVWPDAKQTESFVVAEDPETSTPSTARYVNLTELNSYSGRETRSTAGAPFNATLTMFRDLPGFAIEPTSAPHQLALNHFNGAVQGSSDHVPIFDYQTMHATVYMQFPERVRIEYPDPATRAPIHNSEDIHVIRIGDAGRLDYLATGMVTGVDPATADLVKATSSTWINDDRPYMRDLAQTAYEWYSRELQSVEFTASQITSVMPLGALVNSIHGTNNINTVITSIEWDFTNFSTRVRTEFAELDLTA